MNYDPVTHGARCSECFLRDKRDGDPVGPELNPGAFAMVVGEAPGSVEVEEKKPFAGRSGWEAVTAFAVHGVRRSHVSWTNALMCHPPGDNLDLVLSKFKRENKKREKAGLAHMPSPFECCAPRLERELAGFQNIIALGRIGANAAIGKPQSIMEIRGGPVTLDNGRRVMPTVHPAFVMRMRRWTRAFRSDIGRAVRWFRGDVGWRPPKVTMVPTPAELRRFLTSAKAFAHDVETKSPDPRRPDLALESLLAKLGLWGIATDDEVMVVPFLGVHGEGLQETIARGKPVSPFYTLAEMDENVEILRVWATDPNILKIDFNGYYDIPVIAENLHFEVAPRLDNILQHRDVEPELPHGLGYVASVFTEIPYAWKVNHAATDAVTDSEWREYNSIDAVLEYRITQPLAEGISVRKQQAPLAMHHAIQRYCIGMHRNGIYVNQVKRAEWDGKLRWEAINHLHTARRHLREAGLKTDYSNAFNPGSFQQLGELFFQHWQFTPVKFSLKTGEPSTDDETIRELLRDPKLSVPQRAFLGDLRQFRATTKARSTYVRRMVDFRTLVPKDPLAAIVEIDEEEVSDDEHPVETRKVGRKKKDPAGPYGLVLGDGRGHPNWNTHSVTTGWRLASSDPNAQNWPRRLREIIAPFQGRVFISADQDQGEMRIIAALARAARLLEAFKSGKDPHAINAEGFFGAGFTNASKVASEKGGVSDWDRLRDCSKTLFYCMAYEASFETIYETLTSSEDASGNLPFVNFTKRQVRAALDRFMRMNPEIEKWWEAEVEIYHRQGFLTDPLFDYRMDFLDGEDRNKIVNARAQSLLGAIVQKAAVSLVDGPAPLIPFFRYGHGTGLVLNGHDRLDFEWPVFHERRWQDPKKAHIGWCEPPSPTRHSCTCELEKTRQLVTEAMRQRVPGLDVQFQGAAKIYVGAWA